MTFTRRAFASIALTLAPFLGQAAEVLQVAAPEEPLHPKEFDHSEAVYEAHEPFDMIFAQAMGQKVMMMYPPDHTWINGLGWVPNKSPLPGFEAQALLEQFHPASVVRPFKSPATYTPHAPTRATFVVARPVSNRRSWLLALGFGHRDESHQNIDPYKRTD